MTMRKELNDLLTAMIAEGMLSVESSLDLVFECKGDEDSIEDAIGEVRAACQHTHTTSTTSLYNQAIDAYFKAKY